MQIDLIHSRISFLTLIFRLRQRWHPVLGLPPYTIFHPSPRRAPSNRRSKVWTIQTIRGVE